MSRIDGRWQLPADFLARIRILPPGEGGRPHPSYNGIRWDFSYRAADGSLEPDVFIIWPLFCDAEGQPLDPELPLPVDEWLPARQKYSARILFCRRNYRSCQPNPKPIPCPYGYCSLRPTHAARRRPRR